MTRWTTIAAALPLALLTVTASAPPSGSGTPPGSDAALDPGPIGEPVTLEVDGRLDAVSPDGRWVAGVGEGAVPCVWDVETLTANCADEEVGVGSVPGRAAMTWSPDSGRVAFTPSVLQRALDGDIFVMDTDGELTNLTDDGYDGPFLGADVPADVTVDTIPAWSPDGDRLAFVRAGADEAADSIMTIDATGGEPVEIAVSPVPGRFTVWMGLSWVSDDTILFTTGPADPDDPGRGVWSVDPGSGEVTVIVTEPGRDFQLSSVDAGRGAALVTDVRLLNTLGSRPADDRWGALVTELDLGTGESTPRPWLDVQLGVLAPPPAHAGSVLRSGHALPGGSQVYSPDATMWAGWYHVPGGARYVVVGDVVSGELRGALDLTDADLTVDPSAVQWVDGGVFFKSPRGTAIWLPITSD